MKKISKMDIETRKKDDRQKIMEFYFNKLKEKKGDNK